MEQKDITANIFRVPGLITDNTFQHCITKQVPVWYLCTVSPNNADSALLIWSNSHQF
jgi:hypothetical protein